MKSRGKKDYHIFYTMTQWLQKCFGKILHENVTSVGRGDIRGKYDGRVRLEVKQWEVCEMLQTDLNNQFVNVILNDLLLKRQSISCFVFVLV